jgi:uncharacterized membrane protein
MERLTVWRFDTAQGADEAATILAELAARDVVELRDAAVVSWPAGARRPTSRQLPGLPGAGALGGAFWGLLFGLLFYAPLVGLAVGAAGGVTGALRNVGIDDRFVKRVRDEIRPGTSALFVLGSAAVLDEIGGALTGVRTEPMVTNRSDEPEQLLLVAVAE